MSELIKKIEECYKKDKENSVKCGLIVLANAINKINRGIIDRFTTYDRILASHSRGFKDLRKFITDEVLTRLDKDKQ